MTSDWNSNSNSIPNPSVAEEQSQRVNEKIQKHSDITIEYDFYVLHTNRACLCALNHTPNQAYTKR